MSKVILNVGRTGSGKTTNVKQIIKEAEGMPLYLYDVNNEYGIYKGNTLPKFNEFLQVAKTKTNTLIVFEEATIFFSHKNQAEEITEMLVRKRHTKNLIVFNFHSLRQVPLYIIDFVNILILHTTNDNPKHIISKFEKYEQIFDAYNSIYEENNILQNFADTTKDEQLKTNAMLKIKHNKRLVVVAN
jgi:hypothetical protein